MIFLSYGPVGGKQRKLCIVLLYPAYALMVALLAPFPPANPPASAAHPSHRSLGGSHVTDEEIKMAEDKFAESLHLAQMGMHNLLENDVSAIKDFDSNVSDWFQDTILNEIESKILLKLNYGNNNDTNPWRNV